MGTLHGGRLTAHDFKLLFGWLTQPKDHEVKVDGQAPKGKDRLPVPSVSRDEMLAFLGGVSKLEILHTPFSLEKNPAHP